MYQEVLQTRHKIFPIKEFDNVSTSSMQPLLRRLPGPHNLSHIILRPPLLAYLHLPRFTVDSHHSLVRIAHTRDVEQHHPTTLQPHSAPYTRSRQSEEGYGPDEQ